MQDHRCEGRKAKAAPFGLRAGECFLLGIGMMSAALRLSLGKTQWFPNGLPRAGILGPTGSSGSGG